MLTKLVAIGNSQGIRLPKKLINKYHLNMPLVVEEQEDGIFIHPVKDNLLSWEETYKAMARQPEDWSDLDVLNTDGLDQWK